MTSRTLVSFASTLVLAAHAYAQPVLNECDVGQPCSETYHFLTDSSRHAQVTDRERGYTFEIEYDPTDGNSEDFCPHCRLDLIVSDPGIDLGRLSRVGIERSDVETASGMLTSFQSVAAADPTDLAMMLNVGIMGPELDAAVAEIVAIQAELVTVISALETFERLAGGTFDWTSMGIDALIAALALRVDSGFRADFDSPNDPREHNTGVRVYTPAEFVSALSPAAQSSVQAILSALPGVGGGLEISGDDDDASQPIGFHGHYTDLSVRERTYVVNGTSALLVVYTIVNETTRVFPFVQAAMVADYDIPPLAYDTSTEFDPATNGVLLYDTIPYTMPEQHYWFGLAPAYAGLPGPTTFGFSNWMIDKNFTLAQFGSDTTQQNRYRFFLWDPTISGDHDDAVGKSEKTGAVAMLLGGPLLPGDSRSLAFCYAAGEGGSSGAARAEMTTVMTACRALYTGLTPNCGDGILQLGEDCDGGTACSTDCLSLVCGDGRVVGTEECDDGNLDDGDGCGHQCLREICGNGVVQYGEDCDDGNVTSTDACTTECRNARCGDGYVRSAESCTGTTCGCAGYQYCFTGSFRLSTFAQATGSFFETMRDVPITYLIAFDAATTDRTIFAAESGIQVTTGPVHIEMSGAALASSFAAAAEGDIWTINVRARPATTTTSLFTSSTLRGLVGRTPTDVSFSIDVPRAPSGTREGVTFSLDGAGFPILSTVRISSGLARMAVVPIRGLPTDTARGTATGGIGSGPAVGSGGEQCDDGNASDFDACTNACVPAVCGDSIVQVDIGEECDDGVATATCEATCTRPPAIAAACGDGTLQPANGEECDDANDTDGDGCSAICRTERCGDGIVIAPEECDDGMNGDGDGCTDACVAEICGDSIVQPNEACDEGAANGDTAACRSTCVSALCGDGFVLAGTEECDDGNADSLDGCSATCATESCGDGAPGPDEDCDDGNDVAADGCSPTCKFEICGDALPGPGEQCDDGNLSDGDGCNKDCGLENLADCGNGTVGPGEQCDDGGNSGGDGCSEFCQLENPGACGDGTIDGGEQCDDGNMLDGDGCTARCAEERCGDGIHVRGEACDDGNNANGDGCNAACAAEPADCGNGRQEYGEQCDDGNADDADDCTSDCMLTGTAPLAETCGDGAQDLGEQCDDGDRNEGDGCGETCQLEARACGNARLEYAETCDEGDIIDGDGCSAMCTIEGEIAGGCGCSIPRRSSNAPWLALFALALVFVVRRKRS